MAITPEELSILLCALEHRGNDATGIAIQNDDEPNEIHVYKDDSPAFSFVASQDYKGFLQDHLKATTRTVLLHTRAATVGNPIRNENNHPIYSGRTCIIHNGGISNASTLFTDMHMERSCETDSDVIRAILDTDGMTHKGVRTLNQMHGSAAIAAISTASPDHLLLARSGNPLVYAEGYEKLYWASEFQAIQKAVRPWRTWRGLVMRETAAKVAYFSMPDDSAYLIGPEGLEWHQEFNICANFRPVCYAVHDNYHRKRRNWEAAQRWKERDKSTSSAATHTAAMRPAQGTVITGLSRVNIDVAQCPNCTAAVKKLKVSDSWTNLICWRCKQSLAELAA